YFPDTFYNPFVKHQKQMIRTTLERVRVGGMKGDAYPRGEGKTTIIKGIIMLCICEGWIRFPLLVGGNATEAGRNQKDIQFYFERNDRLAEDYPEVCDPIRELHGAPQRAKGQTFQGKPTGMIWSGEFLRFPEIPGSKAAGALLCSKGIDGAIAGLQFQGLRPDFVAVDDIENRATVKSPKETEDRRIVLINDITPLGGIDKTIGIQLNCTIRKRGCVADEFTDRKLQPAWHGDRGRQLEKLPDRIDLWETYVQLRQQDHFNGDATGRSAAAFYRQHRKPMDAASRVANKYRFADIKCNDGSRLEVSALQACYNIIADHGWEHFNTEYQNDPPDPDPDALRIEMSDVQRKLNGLPRAAIPAWAEAVTTYIDVHGYDIHYATVASAKGFGCAVVDYDVEPVHSPRLGRITDAANVEAVDDAILTALLRWRDEEREGRLAMADNGEIRHADRVIVDAGWKPHPVYEFVKANPGGVYRASNGCGSNEAQKFRMPTKRSKERKLGFHYFASFRPPPERLWLFLLDVDYWKRFAHDAFATAPDWEDGEPGAKPKRGGTITLFGDDPHAHRAFAAEILAERWENDKWVGPTGKKPGKNNHFLDCVAGALCAAAMQGIRPIGSAPPDASPAGQAASAAGHDTGGYKPRKPGAPGSGYKIGR
ncbi:MAG TPA: terminase gpA endonuclease subunit, partial [Planctomycetota bacterium]|nr:terminase gpA endonuclease subunit [Planctomycetota bacterium]